MTFLPLRMVPIPEQTGALYEEWLASLDETLDQPDCDRNEFCTSVLTDLFFPGVDGQNPSSLPLATQVALRQMDPRNVTVEPEYYRDIDLERYRSVKPLIWLWEMFDKSALGENVELGVRFRRMLAKRIFKRCGENFKAFHFVKLSFGYNMDVGDDVVVHRHVLLDDRGGITLGHKASVSDFVNIYSHAHDIIDPAEITTPATTVGNGVRIAYHATILSGVSLGENSMVGAGAMVSRDTEPNAVYAGIPARKVRDKPDRERSPGPADPIAEH